MMTRLSTTPEHPLPETCPRCGADLIRQPGGSSWRKTSPIPGEGEERTAYIGLRCEKEDVRFTFEPSTGQLDRVTP
jgi:hypothetical protein